MTPAGTGSPPEPQPGDSRGRRLNRWFDAHLVLGGAAIFVVAFAFYAVLPGASISVAFAVAFVVAGANTMSRAVRRPRRRAANAVNRRVPAPRSGSARTRRS